MLTNHSMIVIERTLSGGACWNDVSIQTVQRGLPFGGVGESGCECSGLSGSLAGLIVVVIGGRGEWAWEECLRDVHSPTRYVLAHLAATTRCRLDALTFCVNQPLSMSRASKSGLVVSRTSIRARLTSLYHSLEPFMRLRYPNAPKWGMKVFEALIGHKLSFARSTSVAAESKREKSRDRIRKFIKYLIGLIFLLLAKRLRG
jgi:hypothetical protein